MNLNEQLMEALNDIDDRFIEEAEPGKSINVDGDDVDGKTTFICEVS